VGIDALADGLLNPSKLILKTLGVSIPDSDAGIASDREPVEVDGLLGWVLGDAMGRAAFEAAARDGGDEAVERACHVERRKLAAQGRLPLGTAGRHAVKDKIDGAKGMIAALRELTELSCARSLPIEQRIDVADGLVVSLHGEIGPVTSAGDLIQFDFKEAAGSRPAMYAWIRLIAARAAHGEAVKRALLIDSKGKAYALQPPEDPARTLTELLTLRRRSRTMRIPLARKSSHAVAKKLFATLRDGSWGELDELLQEAVLADAEKAWDGDQGGSRGDSSDRWVQTAWGDTLPYQKDDQLDPAFVQAAELLWKPLFLACPELVGTSRARQSAPDRPSDPGKKAPARRSGPSRASGKTKGAK